jgi:rubredoxin
MTTTSEAYIDGQKTAEEHGPEDQVDTLVEEIGGASFEGWYREREFAQNIREGQPYFNGPSRIQSPERHSPSKIGQCHRRVFYRQLNAPEEDDDPDGILWVGQRFEDELVVPYLEAVVGPDQYVTNSLWVDFTCDTDAGEIHIKGATDPVIVDPDSTPILLTESKTKRSIDGLEGPDHHHLAQTHCYLYGLTQKHDCRVTDALLLYGSRTSLKFRAFHVEFDPWFWRETVLGWAAEHTRFRLDEELPPADPGLPWECNVCSFSHRCGQADDTTFADVGASGFLPRFEDYPRRKVAEYLDSHDGARLTPALARRYPDLLDHYKVHDWVCRRCSAAYDFEDVDPDGDIAHDDGAADTPLCPACTDEHHPIPLKGPAPDDQAFAPSDD